MKKKRKNLIRQLWIKWAKSKADWFDPTKTINDEYLGKRQHSKSKEEKELGSKTNLYSGYGWYSNSK